MLLEKLFGSRIRAKIVEHLFGHPQERFYARQLTTLLREDPTNLSRELDRLNELGVLSCRTEGRRKYYRANAYCPIYRELLGIASKMKGRPGVVSDTGTPPSRKKYPWLWDVDMDSKTFRAVLAGKRKDQDLDWKWAMARLIDYAPYEEIRQLLPKKLFVSRWKEVAPLVRSATRREGMAYLHETMKGKRARG
jgi:DNA-binding transcriptional ArsR family regulator